MATGDLSLCFVVVRWSRGGSHKEYQSVAGERAGGAEFTDLAPADHHAGFSLSVSSIRYGFDCAGVTICAATNAERPGDGVP